LSAPAFAYHVCCAGRAAALSRSTAVDRIAGRTAKQRRLPAWPAFVLRASIRYCVWLMFACSPEYSGCGAFGLPHTGSNTLFIMFLLLWCVDSRTMARLLCRQCKLQAVPGSGRVQTSHPRFGESRPLGRPVSDGIKRLFEELLQTRRRGQHQKL